MPAKIKQANNAHTQEMLQYNEQLNQKNEEIDSLNESIETSKKDKEEAENKLDTMLNSNDSVLNQYAKLVKMLQAAFISAHKQEKLFTINGAWKQRLALFEC